MTFAPMRNSPILRLLIALAVSSCNALETSGDPDSSTTVYLTEAEALHVVFPDAARIVEENVTLSADERRAAEEILESRIGERTFTVHAGIRADGRLDGLAVIHEEIGKFKPFRFIVGTEPDGSVRRVAVLVYRESRGGEVAHRRFLTQYSGKTAADPIHLNRDIINISGATMSVSALNYGVKKVLALIEVVYRRNPERLGKLIESGPVSHVASSPEQPLAEAPTELREARYVMGSICEIRAHGPDREKLRASIARAFREIEAADRALSDWRPDSELSAVSREGGRAAVPVSELTASFLQLAERISRESRGAFDITVGPLVRAWGFRGKPARPLRAPSLDDLEGLRPLVGHEKVELLRDGSGAWSARVAREGMILDPGALGKGFAVDLASRRLAQDGVESALIDFSGNMYAIGAPPGTDAWLVAVRDPSRPDAVLGTVKLRDRAISSSGGYEKWIEIDGVRRGHILSPHTLAPVDAVLGATVMAPTAAFADGYSTAACVLCDDAAGFLASQTGVEGIIALRADGGGARFERTNGWVMR
jgi:thiamine biosynthesis lipoprotein